MLDNSKSLSIKTFPQEISRADLVRKTLEFNKKYFDQLKTEFNVDTYFVSDGVKKPTLDWKIIDLTVRIQILVLFWRSWAGIMKISRFRGYYFFQTGPT